MGPSCELERDDIYITDELHRRVPSRKDSRSEKSALQQMSAAMADGSSTVLPRFVDLAMTSCGAVSAGLSIYERGEQEAPGRFRWRHLRGTLARFEGATTPRDSSPCGVTLDRNGPVLARHPERLYAWIEDAGIVVPEVLLVPLYLGGTEPMGTLWLVSDRPGHFTREQARIATELASLVGVSLRIEQTEERLRETIAEQELLVREMSHRVKNLFAVTDGLLRASARGCATPQELVERYSARMLALSKAHDLAIRRQTAQPGGRLVLADLIAIILAPHDEAQAGSISRFAISGPDVVCGEHATNSIALVLHELATNAIKYGALSRTDGRIDVSWTLCDDEIVLAWSEHGGPTLAAPPSKSGFGFSLAERTLRQAGGWLVLDWAETGLRICVHLPRHALTS